MKKLLILICLFGLFSCQKTTDEKELNLRISGLQQPEEKTFFRTFIKLFEAEHGIKTNVIYESSDEVYQQIKTEVDSKQVHTDVVMIDTANIAKYMDNNYLSEITYLEELTDRTFVSSFDSYIKKDDMTYLALVSYDVYLTLINKLALPYIPSSVLVIRDEHNDIIEIEKLSWQDLFLWAKRIKNETNESRFGFPYGEVTSQLIYPLSGLSASLDDYSLPSVNSIGFLKAMGYLEDLYESNALSYGSSFQAVTQPTRLLESGELWLSYGHIGPLGNAYIDHPNDYLVASAPIDRVTNTRATTSGAWGYGLIKGHKNKESAKKWLTFITDPEINYLYTTGLGGVISPILQVTNELGNSPADIIMKAGLKMANESLVTLVVKTNNYTSWDEVKRLYVSIYEDMLSGIHMDLDYLNEKQKELDALLIT
jgi:multiple sugar transport system substrate-binding protein